jgi:hypothetical protein
MPGGAGSSKRALRRGAHMGDWRYTADPLGAERG